MSPHKVAGSFGKRKKRIREESQHRGNHPSLDSIMMGKRHEERKMWKLFVDCSLCLYFGLHSLCLWTHPIDCRFLSSILDARRKFPYCLYDSWILGSGTGWGATAVLRGSTDEVEILISVLEARSEQNSPTVIECAVFIVLVYSGNSWFRSLTLKAVDQHFVCWLPCLYHRAIIILTLVVVRNK